jgi:hypothetical protein
MQAASTIHRPGFALSAQPGVGLGLIPPALMGRVAPAATRARRGRGSERYYVGRRPHATEVYIVSGTDVERLEHLGYRSAAPFDWGGSTPGALELAFALLAHTTESPPPEPICQTFRADVVGGLDRAGFVLGDGDIALWLLTAFRDDAHNDPFDPRRCARIRRAARWLRSRLRHR